jgi:Ca2+-binding RTX toxin-like protein
VVAGAVDPRGLAATYWVEYGRTTAYGLRTGSSGLQAGTGPVSVSFPLAGLGPGLRYHYRVVAQSAGGTTVGDDRSFGTSPLPRNPQGRLVRCTIVGTVGPDRLRGTPGADVICGLGGGDVILGLGGNDVIYGGPGDDVLDGGAGRDIVYGGLGSDHLAGGIGADTLDGGAGGDIILGGPGRDMVRTRDGVADTVNGGPGRDRGWFDRRRDRRVSVELLLR